MIFMFINQLFSCAVAVLQVGVYPVIKCTPFFVHRREPDTQQYSDNILGNKDKQLHPERKTKNSYDAVRKKIIDFLHRNLSRYKTRLKKLNRAWIRFKV